MAAEKVVVEPEDWLLAGILEELVSAGLILKSRGIGAAAANIYATRAPAARAHLLLGVGKAELTTLQKRRLGALAARVLLAYLSRRKISLGVKRLIICLDKLPEALEESFPDYWRNGMLLSCI